MVCLILLGLAVVLCMNMCKFEGKWSGASSCVCSHVMTSLAVLAYEYCIWVLADDPRFLLMGHAVSLFSAALCSMCCSYMYTSYLHRFAQRERRWYANLLGFLCFAFLYAARLIGTSVGSCVNQCILQTLQVDKRFRSTLLLLLAADLPDQVCCTQHPGGLCCMTCALQLPPTQCTLT